MEKENVGFHERLIGISTAAERLGVSTKTVQRYLAKGHLTKVKLGIRTYIDSQEIELILLPPFRKSHQRDKDTDRQHQDRRTSNLDTVSLSRARYEALLIELGELRKQNEILLTDRARHESRLADLERRERQLDQTLARLKSGESRKSARESELAAANERIRELESQLSRFQSQRQWWQR